MWKGDRDPQKPWEGVGGREPPGTMGGDGTRQNCGRRMEPPGTAGGEEGAPWNCGGSWRTLLELCEEAGTLREGAQARQL